MSTDTVALSLAEVREIDHFLESIGYECDLILQDIRDPDEVRAFHFRRVDNARHQVDLALAINQAAVGASVLLPAVTYRAIASDLDWLTEEWHEAMKAMDAADRRDYERAAKRLAALLGQLGSR